VAVDECKHPTSPTHSHPFTPLAPRSTGAQVLGKDVGKAVDILSDILLNSNLDERAINRERDVILREMEEVGKGALSTEGCVTC